MKREILILIVAVALALMAASIILKFNLATAGVAGLLFVLLIAVAGALSYYWKHDSQIKRLERIKTEFVSVVSHQLRTPLTAMNWYLEMLMAGDAGKVTSQQKDYLEEIYRSSNRMVGLVNDLLNISRLESGRLRIAPEAVNIAELIQGIIKELEPLTRAKNCDVLFENIVKQPTVPVDPRLMRQVINNLLTNAIKYTDGKKRNCYLAVGLKEDSRNLLVTVADNGIGIPAAVQSRIFEKFVRADNAIKAEAEGSGLGLYIARMIMEASGGDISFKSKEGSGTTFTVRIPKAGMEKREGEKGLA